MLQVLFIVHLMGCLWYLVAVIDGSPETWINRYGYTDFSDFRLYLYCIYFVLMTISTVGYGDISGTTIYE